MVPETNSARVGWLERAYARLRESFLADAPERAMVTVGFPVRNAQGKRIAVGQCWCGWKHGEGLYITLHPMIFSSPLHVLETLLHEMIHATVGLDCGHKGKFRERMKAVGLEGEPTATHAGEECAARLVAIAEGLGGMPAGYGELVPKVKVQTTRLRKWKCSGDCGQIVRAATDSLNVICGECRKPYEMEEAKQ
jgi:hypothetical protein